MLSFSKLFLIPQAFTKKVLSYDFIKKIIPNLTFKRKKERDLLYTLTFHGHYNLNAVCLFLSHYQFISSKN